MDSQRCCDGTLARDPAYILAMERDWVDRRAGVGGQERRCRDGELTSAP